MTLVQGLIVKLAPRYNGNGTYAHDNGTGEALRLLRPMGDGNDWYCSDDLTSPVAYAKWSCIVHVSRLQASEVLGFCLDAAREAAAQRQWEREALRQAPRAAGFDDIELSPNWLNEPPSDAGGL